MKKFLLASIFACLLLAGCIGTAQQPTPVPTAQPTAPSAAPTATAQPTAASTPTPTPAPEYAQMDLSSFIEACSGKAVLEGFFKFTLVRDNETAFNNYAISDSRGKLVPIEGYPPADKPASVDASGSSEYKFYGTASQHAKGNFSDTCWLKIERITAK